MIIELSDDELVVVRSMLVRELRQLELIHQLVPGAGEAHLAALERAEVVRGLSEKLA